MHEIALERAERVAVLEHGHTLTYAELDGAIGQLHEAMGTIAAGASEPIGLLLDRSALAYAAMWASIAHGRAYVPLNTAYPHSRLKSIIDQAGIGTVVCDESTRDLASALGIDADRLVIAALPDRSGGAPPPPRRPWWRLRAGQDIAYILFTSGSTGRPKGVPISYDNLLAFIENMRSTIEYRQDDVCSQLCELSFDFSVHEIYLALLNGCTLCPARRIDLFDPARYVAARKITVLIAVPSLVRVMLGNGVAVGESLHGLRAGICNGEALTSGLAGALHDAAPNAEIWNTYGPTECTVAVTAQRWSRDPEIEEADVVSIGVPFPDCRAALLERSHVVRLSETAGGTAGELLLATPQRFSGYTDPGLASPFVTDDRGEVYYRTGDRVLWRSGRLYHLGRIDHQVKIGGHRIELMEIERRLRSCLDTESLAVIAHPAGRPTELVLFVERTVEPFALDREALGLPQYMIPARTVVLDALPTNDSGKLDRTALQASAETGH